MSSHPQNSQQLLKESDFIGFSQTPSDQRVKFLQSPLGYNRIEYSQNASPPHMTQSYFQDSDSKAQHGQNNQINHIITTTSTYTKVGQNNPLSTFSIPQSSYSQANNYTYNLVSDNNYLNLPFNSQTAEFKVNQLPSTSSQPNMNKFNSISATNIGVSNQQRSYSFDGRGGVSTNNGVLSTLQYESKQPSVQERNSTERSKRGNDQQYLKEKSIVNNLIGDRDQLSSKFNKDSSDHKIDRFKQVSPNSSQLYSVQQSKDEVSRLYTICKEKDEIISNLMKEKPSIELMEADKMGLYNQNQSQKNTIIELENKTVMLSTENERLNRKVQDREFEIQKKNSENAFCEERLKIEMEELIQNYEERLNKMIMENEKISMINESLRSKLEQTQDTFQEREERMEEQSNQIRSYWQEYYQRELNEFKSGVELDKSVHSIEANRLKSTNEENEYKIRQYQNEILQLKQQLVSKDEFLSDVKFEVNLLDKKKQEIFELQEQLNTTKRSVSDLESRVVLMISENTRLVQINENYKQEIESWKFRINEIEQNHATNLRESLRKSEEQGIRAKKEVQQENEEQMTRLLMKIVVVQTQNESAHNQISDLHKIIDDQRYEIRQKEQKVQQLEYDYNMIAQRNEDLQRKIESLILNVDELNSGLKMRIDEVELWRKRLGDSQAEWESKYNNRIYQFERQIEDKNIQIDTLERSYSSLKFDKDRESLMLKEKTQLSEQLLMSIGEMREERDRQQKMIDEQSWQLKMRQEEMAKFNALLQDNQQLLSIAQEAEDLKQEIERLKHISQSEQNKLSIKCEEERKRYEKEISNLKEEISVFETKISIRKDQHSQQIQEMQLSHKNEICDIKANISRDFDIRFNTHSEQLRLIISDREKEIKILKGDNDRLLTELNVERSKYHRCMLDLEQACRDVDAWKSKALQIDGNHPYIIDLQNQLESKRIECIQYLSRLQDIDRKQSSMQIQQISKTRLRAPSCDGYSHKQNVIIVDRQAKIDLGFIHENDQFNKMILSRCRQIVSNQIY